MCVRCAVKSHLPPVQILLHSIMELAIDEALPQALLPGVDGQVVDAKQEAPIIECA